MIYRNLSAPYLQTSHASSDHGYLGANSCPLLPLCVCRDRLDTQMSQSTRWGFSELTFPMSTLSGTSRRSRRPMTREGTPECGEGRSDRRNPHLHDLDSSSRSSLFDRVRLSNQSILPLGPKFEYCLGNPCLIDRLVDRGRT